MSKLYWFRPVEVTVLVAGVVEPVDAFEGRGGKNHYCVPLLPVHQFDLPATPKRFDNGAVVGVTNTVKQQKELCLPNAPG